tara:strand:- start:1725 stop:1946 length:222 start_codon:yes stop_codon:yes gene_type:complete
MKTKEYKVKESIVDKMFDDYDDNNKNYDPDNDDFNFRIIIISVSIFLLFSFGCTIYGYINFIKWIIQIIKNLI